MPNLKEHQKTKSLPELKGLNILEDVLNKIWSGELEHYQGDFFCNTAKCVAGWIVALDYPQFNCEKINYDMTFNQPLDHIPDSVFNAIDDPWKYAQERIGLTDLESFLIFCWTSTKRLQEKALKAFKSGKRLREGLGYEGIVIRSGCYEGNAEILIPNWFSPHVKEELKEFLGVDELIF